MGIHAQRTRLQRRVATGVRLWAKTTDAPPAADRCRARVGVHEFLSKCAIGPQNARVCVASCSPRIDSGIHHLRVAGELIGEAPADVSERTATQIHQMSALVARRSDRMAMARPPNECPTTNYMRRTPEARVRRDRDVGVRRRRSPRCHRSAASIDNSTAHVQHAQDCGGDPMLSTQASCHRTVNQRKSRHAQSREMTMPSSMDRKAALPAESLRTSRFIGRALLSAYDTGTHRDVLRAPARYP